MRNATFLVASLADFTGVWVHGVLGYRVLIAPLFPDRLFATPSFGDEDITRRIFIVAWHLVTAVFFCSGVALLLLGLGVIGDAWLPRFVGLVHGSFVLLALAVVGARLPATVRRPIPIAFLTCMSAVAVLGWLG